MPHLIIEHSANVAAVAEISALVDALHAATLATGIALPDALRTRAAARTEYAVGDRHPDNAFIAVTARLGPGRSDADKQALINALMSAVEVTVGDAMNNMMLSVELQEIDPAMRLNHNHLRTRIDGRSHRPTNTDLTRG